MSNTCPNHHNLPRFGDSSKNWVLVFGAINLTSKLLRKLSHRIPPILPKQRYSKSVNFDKSFVHNGQISSYLAEMTLLLTYKLELWSATRCHAEPQTGDCQSDLLYARSHFIRYTTTRRDTITQVTKSVYLTQFFSCTNKDRVSVIRVLQKPFTFKRCKTPPRSHSTAQYSLCIW